MSEDQLSAPALEAQPAEEAPTALPTERVASSDERPSRPGVVPEKFWDAAAGTLRTEALLKSYVELERKLGSMISLPSDDRDEEGHQRLRRALGVPEAPEDYRIEPSCELIGLDPQINARLHAAGFTPRQAQLVYDLAAEHLVPVVDQALGELETGRDAERLATHFGGQEAWRTMAHQIRTWGEANLAGEVFETLASNYDGVLAMHQMMQAREPAVLREAGAPASR
ncbi:MAG: hypothetical protein ACREH6_06885, partial [Geminicoccaceae bacterium]